MNTTPTTHTPGPWYEMTKGENNYQSAICEETTGKTVALTYTSNDADARLIAAAPALLAALKETLELFDRDPQHQPSPIQSGEAIDRALAAIAQAESEG